MDIQISQTFAKIGIETTPGKLDIRTQKAVLQLHHEDSKVVVHNEFPKIQISNRECFNTSGLKDLETFSHEAASIGYRAAMNYISKTASDGNSLAGIENHSNPIPSIAKRDAYPTHEFGIDSIPKARPQISVSGRTEINVANLPEGSNNGVIGTYSPASASINAIPANVSIYMLQNPSIDIKYVGKYVDVYK